MKRGIIGYFSAILMGLILLTGCSREVQTQRYATSIDMNKYRTYAWLPAGDTTWSDFNTDNTVAEEIRNEVNQELQRRGYILDTQDPDFLVLVHTKYDERIELQTAPSGYYYYGPGFYTGPWYDYYYPYYNNIGYLPGPDIREEEYIEGSMIIDIIDAEKKQIVWRGTAMDTEYGNDDMDEDMADAVDEIFDDFPSGRICRNC